MNGGASLSRHWRPVAYTRVVNKVGRPLRVMYMAID